jgi:hypothetical protein
MRDAHSSYLSDALLATQLASRDAAPKSAAGSRFSPLAWLRGRLFGSRSFIGSTLVPASSSIPTAPVESRGQALRNAHRSLYALLKDRPALRKLMPHLAYIERALRRHGSLGLVRLSATVLQRGLEQLDTLQADEPRDALRALRTRLAEALALRIGAGAAVAAPTTTLAAMEVMEASHSEFDEAERSWTGSMPLESPRWDDDSRS